MKRIWLLTLSSLLLSVALGGTAFADEPAETPVERLRLEATCEEEASQLSFEEADPAGPSAQPPEVDLSTGHYRGICWTSCFPCNFNSDCPFSEQCRVGVQCP